ncbi:MotA/TolQ/ExbB proton channel family protein [Facilibium subflavum]|uniref:MotA/TolQ/ExbB proton channel family protein n=1 Tax=Facilibium subflavum TaxID=2219058 RepID=UPI000E65096E|nr:MotA/TolQ/ExbB proton channel family protein [Facilibium subflavum]
MGNLYTNVGIVGFILIFLGIFVLTILIVKGWQFARMGVWHKKSMMFYSNAADQQQCLTLVGSLQQSRHPVCSVIKALIQLKFIEKKQQTVVDSEVRRIAQYKLNQLEQYLRPLEVLSHLSPLIGLLGTVIGIIMAFSAIKSASYVDPGLLSSGISHALITTALGLSVAIPAQIGFHYLDAQVERIREIMSDQVTRINHLEA